MIERIVVARVESIPFSPIFAKIATRAAIIAERKAKTNQFISVLIFATERTDSTKKLSLIITEGKNDAARNDSDQSHN